MNVQAIEQDVMRYWTVRTPSFKKIREGELHNEIGEGWRKALVQSIPKDRYEKILDVGTGSGFFSVILAGEGYEVTGIDLTPSMIKEAKAEAELCGVRADFKVMDAQKLAYLDETFDAVISRNLTWTLPDPEKAYKEWYRVLKPGGLLINYDANYAEAIRSGDVDRTESGDKIAYGHDGVTAEMTKLNNDIALELPIGMQNRPDWDIKILEQIGFTQCEFDYDEPERILGIYTDPAAPLFKITAVK